MKVAHLTAHVSPRAGGLYFAVQQLVRHLARDTDVSVEVVGLSDRRGGGAPSWADLPLHLCRQSGPRRLGYASGLRPTLERLDADAVHAQGLWMYPSAVGRRWSRGAGRPHLVSPHGMLDPWALARSAWRKRLAGWLFENAHLHGAACLHALSTGEALAIRSHGLRNPVCIVPNGVELPELPASRDPGRNTRTLLFLGRLAPKKGLRELLHAWAAAGRAVSDWRLRIAGWDEGGHGDELRRLLDRLGPGPGVDLTGPAFDADKEAALREADAFVLPSFSEGLPMAVLEAWSHRLPVLMTDACNLPEGFDAGAAIRMAPEPASIALGLRRLVAMSDSERLAMGALGRALVERRFAWPTIARRMRDVYAWVLGGGPAPSCVITD
jgi:glycosyltransferase involved in cell wall biosynthesis